MVLLKRNIFILKDISEVQGDLAHRMEEKLKDEIGASERLNGHIEDHSAYVPESSSAREQMMANIASVTQTLVKDAQNIKNLTESSVAVVADEIRKLAESSGEQTKTISTVLKRIKDSIVGIIHSSEEVLAKFMVIEA